FRRVAGMLTVTHTSESSGRLDDWVATAQVGWAAYVEPEYEALSAEEGSDADGVSYRCARCDTFVAWYDHGFLCDVEGCEWGVCVDCHEGGPGLQLLCPAHTEDGGGR